MTWLARRFCERSSCPSATLRQVITDRAASYPPAGLGGAWRVHWTGGCRTNGAERDHARLEEPARPMRSPRKRLGVTDELPSRTDEHLGGRLLPPNPAPTQQDGPAISDWSRPGTEHVPFQPRVAKYAARVHPLDQPLKSGMRSYSGAIAPASPTNSLPQCGRAANGASADSTSTSTASTAAWCGCQVK